MMTDNRLSVRCDPKVIPDNLFQSILLVVNGKKIVKNSLQKMLYLLLQSLSQFYFYFVRFTTVPFKTTLTIMPPQRHSYELALDTS